MKVKHIYTLLLFFSFAFVQAQQQQIEIKYSGFLEFKEADTPGLKIMTRDDSGQIHIIHEGVDMWCDQALLYSNDNFVEAYGNVKMKQGDSINMTSKYVEYSGKTKLAFASGDVILKEPASTLTTDTLYFDRAKQQSFYKSGGKVVRDSSGTITSQIGRYYMNSQKYQFVKNVKLVNPDYTIDTERLDFFTETGHAFLYGPSTIVTADSKIYCEKGFFNTETKQGYAVKKSRIDYENRIFEGDSMYFDNNQSFASATNNITVTDTINKSIVKGHYAEIYKLKDSVFITKRALAISVQENDSVYMHADTLMVTGKAEKRITRAYKNAKFFKTDMSGKADSIHVNHLTGLTQLINLTNTTSKEAFVTKRQPILWNLGNQMTGDTIQIKSNPKTEKLDSLLVFDNAFIISKDTLGAGYNQIVGKILIGLFDEDNTLKQVDINKNAESIYFARNEKNELVGIDKSKSGSIMMLFSNGDIDELRKIRQVDGKTYPESEFPENVRKLRGFNWREEERPKNVEDLFSDDPPLVLPIIKGLEDYIPQEDFFDDAMLERMDKADKSEAKKSKTPVTNPKASRNVPKNSLNKGVMAPAPTLLKEKSQLIEPKKD
ncbi:OstA-like protein [Lacinutrix himadriensis]|uniref:OstA-like protein n=1 Tax=Lacinutrix himadriensis TaxID=641549 RepID=UPI0006E238C1|nr:OstA-like protein [Lacinutrix himadriensis]